METAIGERLLKVRALSDAVAWYDVNIRPSNKRFLMDLIRIKQLRTHQIAGDGDIIGTYSMTTTKLSFKTITNICLKKSPLHSKL